MIRTLKGLYLKELKQKRLKSHPLNLYTLGTMYIFFSSTYCDNTFILRAII